jgi:hypothetical protein
MILQRRDMKKLLLLSLVLSFNAFSAENCLIDVSADASVAIEKALMAKGYQVTDKSIAQYELIFDEYVARPIFADGGYRSLGADDKMISVKGHVVMKINKFVGDKKVMQFGLKQAGSITVKAEDTFKSSRKKLYEQRIQSKKLVKNIPSCKSLK